MSIWLVKLFQTGNPANNDNYSYTGGGSFYIVSYSFFLSLSHSSKCVCFKLFLTNPKQTNSFPDQGCHLEALNTPQTPSPYLAHESQNVFSFFKLLFCT